MIVIVFLINSLFWKIGSKGMPPDWIGLSFFMAVNPLMMSAMAVCTMIPEQVPVYKREKLNKMYNSGAYFWARYLSTLSL